MAFLKAGFPSKSLLFSDASETVVASTVYELDDGIIWMGNSGAQADYTINYVDSNKISRSITGSCAANKAKMVPVPQHLGIPTITYSAAAAIRAGVIRLE